jgi:hypothetical protein
MANIRCYRFDAISAPVDVTDDLSKMLVNAGLKDVDPVQDIPSRHRVVAIFGPKTQYHYWIVFEYNGKLTYCQTMYLRLTVRMATVVIVIDCCHRIFSNLFCILCFDCLY